MDCMKVLITYHRCFTVAIEALYELGRVDTVNMQSMTGVSATPLFIRL
jgi:hypothetical protein